MSDTLYTAAEIAAAAGISKPAVRKAIASRGITPAEQRGQTLLYSAEAADAIIKAAKERREFTENHREPPKTAENHREPETTENHREPPETTGNQETENQPETVDISANCAEPETENREPETTGNHREPRTENHREPPETRQTGAVEAYTAHLEEEVAYLRQQLDDQRADLIRQLEEERAQTKEANRRADQAEQRCGVMITHLVQQAQLLEAARDAAAKPIKAKKQPGPFRRKLHNALFTKQI